MMSSWFIISPKSPLYDRFHSKCYTPEIHQSQKLKFHVTNSNSTSISIWICTTRHRGIWVSRSGGFGGCRIFGGICHSALQSLKSQFYSELGDIVRLYIYILWTHMYIYIYTTVSLIHGTSVCIYMYEAYVHLFLYYSELGDIVHLYICILWKNM